MKEKAGDGMNSPKMILFDYGNTLLYEPDFNTLRGERALSGYIKRNRNGLSPEEIDAFSQKLYKQLHTARELGVETHERQFQQLLYEYLGIEFSISYAEMETVFWDNASWGAVMPGADRVLNYLDKHSVRSGVISNIGFSGEALTKRLNRLLPDNRFEFVIASSEYVLRKPSRLLFELALGKAGLDASEVWFCGDTVQADIDGASGAGIFPVWYENLEIENPWSHNEGISPDCEHLHIHQWDELMAVLESLQ